MQRRFGHRGEEANQGGERRTRKLHLAHLSTQFSARPTCIRSEQGIRFGTTHSRILCHPGLTRQRQDRDPVRRGIRLRKPCEPNEYWIPAFAGMTRLMGFRTRRLNTVPRSCSGGSVTGVKKRTKAVSGAPENFIQPICRPGFQHGRLASGRSRTPNLEPLIPTFFVLPVCRVSGKTGIQYAVGSDFENLANPMNTGSLPAQG